MYGVIIPGDSAGSNQVGASVMWTPHVSCPSGAAPERPGASRTAQETRVTRTARYRVRSTGTGRFTMVTSRSAAIIGDPAGLSIASPDPLAFSGILLDLFHTRTGRRPASPR